MQNSEKKTSVVSFRLPEHLLDALRDEAGAERISLNTLVNQIVDRHVEWDVYAEKLGMLTLGRGVYSALLESADERLLSEKGKQAGLKLKDFLFFKYKRADLESLVDLISSRRRDFGVGEIEVSRRGPNLLLLLHHDFGLKHSVFFGSFADTAIQSLVGLKPRLQITDNSIVVEFAAGSHSLTAE